MTPSDQLGDWGLNLSKFGFCFFNLKKKTGIIIKEG